MPNTTENVEVFGSKSKTFLLILGSIAFVLAGIYMYNSADAQTSYNPLLLKAVGVVGGLFFALGTGIGFIKLFDKRPELVINGIGITINYVIKKSHIIPWDTITGFTRIQIKRTKFILIHINNANELINSTKGIKKQMMRFSQNTYGSPLSISSGTLKISHAELEELLRNRLDSIKTHKAIPQQNTIIKSL